MRSFIKGSSLLLFPMLFSLFLSPVKADLYIYILTNKENVGDTNQLLGIQNAFKTISKENMQFANFDYKNVSEITSHINSIDFTNSTNSLLILGVGDYGLDTMKTLQQQTHSPKIWYGISSHQITKNLPQAVGKVNFIALPKHAVTSEFQREIDKNSTTLIQTIGVAHNLSQSDILAAYEDARKANLIPTSPKYLGVVLAGDAPDSEGKIHYYTRAEAEKLAKHLSSLLTDKETTLLITNGPRTGKYFQDSGRIDEKAHKNGQMDHISSAFVETLKNELTAKGIPLNRFVFADFQVGSPSLVKAIFGAVLQTQGQLYLPGESVSMISEAADTVGKDLLIVYLNRAMNDFHHKYVDMESSHGRVKVITEDFKTLPPRLSSSPTPQESAAAFIAKTIYQKIKP